MSDSKTPCSSCGSTSYHAYRYIVPSDGSDPYSQCSECHKIQIWDPDVYFDPSKGENQTDPNLVDRHKGQMTFSSKKEKAIIMKQLGLREAGDKERGARNDDIWRHKKHPKKYFFT